MLIALIALSINFDCLVSTPEDPSSCCRGSTIRSKLTCRYNSRLLNIFQMNIKKNPNLLIHKCDLTLIISKINL